jgi:hypothetical protein
VAEIPAVPGCYASMPSREAALAELVGVFEMIRGEYLETGQTLPTTEWYMPGARADEFRRVDTPTGAPSRYPGMEAATLAPHCFTFFDRPPCDKVLRRRTQSAKKPFRRASLP